MENSITKCMCEMGALSQELDINISTNVYKKNDRIYMSLSCQKQGKSVKWNYQMSELNDLETLDKIRNDIQKINLFLEGDNLI